MRSQEEKIGPVWVLKLTHPIDRDHVDEIETWVEEKLQLGERFLLLNCARSLYFDSVGLETMLAMTRAATGRGARFALAQLSSDCATALRVTRLERAIEHYVTLEYALKHMRGRAA